MAQVLVTESYLDDIADAIRTQNGSEDTYTPAEMADAIEDLYPEPSGSISITQNGTVDVKSKASAVVDVPNSYAAGDEGKVVSNGELVAQSSVTKTANGTYDTTLNNEVVVDVPTTQTLVQKSITSNGTYNPSDDNADGYSQVTVNVSGGGNNDAMMNVDFTKNTFSYLSVDYGLTGAIFGNTSNYIPLNMPRRNDITLEIDVAMMQLSAGTHRRFVMATNERGFIYRSNGVWAFYNNSWRESNISDGSFFDGSIVGIYIDNNDYWHIYKNGNLIFEPDVTQALNSNSYSNWVGLGSNYGNSINNARITGVRAYIGNKYI